jgi:hypothetical protein
MEAVAIDTDLHDVRGYHPPGVELNTTNNREKFLDSGTVNFRLIPDVAKTPVFRKTGLMKAWLK